jgi:hypothetical protein
VVVQIQVISRQTSSDLARTFMERAAELRSKVAERIAADIVDFSPVDTGTYVMAHVASTGPSSAKPNRTSADKTRGRDPQQFKNLALGNLRRSVSKEAILQSSEIYFSNRAEHAERVEFLGWTDKGGRGADHVYARAEARVAQHIADVAAEMGVTRA